MAEWRPSKQLGLGDVQRVLRENLHSDHLLADRVQSVLSYHFQQSINCCQTTAIAYALSVLGFRTTPDDIFWTVEVDIDTAVHEGMTLAETHELALRYIRKRRLPVFVEAYHFDPHTGLTPDDLWAACWEDGRSGSKDVLAFNFHSGIAHGHENGGGHFSLLVTADPETRELIVADVHAMKYGAYWSTPVQQMFAAMANQDLDVGRARGLLRFGLRGHDLERPLPALQRASRVIDWVVPPEPYLGSYLQRFIPAQWFSFMGARNMEGPSAVALGCGVLEEDAPQVATMDRIMRTLRESYTEHLNRFSEPEELHDIASRLARKNYIRAQPTLHALGDGFDAETLRSALRDNGCGTGQAAILAPFDVDVAYGGSMGEQLSDEANLLSHGARTWALLAAFDAGAASADPNGVVVAAAHGVTRHGRLWRCSLDAMAAAIRAVGARHLLVLRTDALIDQHARLEQMLALLDRTHDGLLEADELRAGLAEEGFELSEERARAMVRAASRTGADVLDHTEAMELLVDFLGFHPDHADPDHPRNEALSAFLAAHGCEPNELGFATVHLAMCTADIHRNVKFYNQVLGWPLYKTIDRAHAGHGTDAYGSSWASYGAFASFTVFHEEPVPVGRAGHGPWADPYVAPKGLVNARSNQTTIAFRDIPFPFIGVVLEPGFFALQMERVAAKDPAVRWLPVEDAEALFGGAEIASAVVMRDPDGFPLVLFVSRYAGDEYAQRFPATPFVYATDIRACYPSPSAEELKRRLDEEHISTCPIVRKYRTDPATALTVRKWLNRHAYGQNSLQQHRRYYEQVLGCQLRREVRDAAAEAVQLEYEWDRHFMVLRTSQHHAGIMSGGADQHHDMGGNKGLVPVPHFGVNTSHQKFSALRKAVTQAMEEHGVPYDMCASLSAIGHAPPYNALDSYHLLFPRDPDSCLSMLSCDPSGNINEVKFYLDFGEMFHGSGSLGIGDLAIDNSLVEKHFPPAVLRMLERRGLRGEADGVEVLRQEQRDLESGSGG